VTYRKGKTLRPHNDECNVATLRSRCVRASYFLPFYLTVPILTFVVAVVVVVLFNSTLCDFFPSLDATRRVVVVVFVVVVLVVVAVTKTRAALVLPSVGVVP
jgi:hypothetical protein